LRGIPRGAPAKSVAAADMDRVKAQGAKTNEPLAQSSEVTWAAVDDHQAVITLAAPKVAVLANQQAVVSLVSPSELQYLVRESADTFKLKKTEPKELGVEIKLMVSPLKDDPEQV